MAKGQSGVPATNPEEQKERILYIYRCPKCGKFYKEGCRHDGLVCSCGTTTVMSTPEYTIKHYKRTRAVYNLLTILFTILLPILTLCMFMFVKEPVEASPSSINYKLPILSFVLIGAIVLRGKDLLDRAANNTNIFAIRCIMVFISKNALYLIILGILGIILGFLDQIGPAIQDIITALGIVVVENTIGYCIFDYQYRDANYIIKRALRQSETIQAMEMSGR